MHLSGEIVSAYLDHELTEPESSRAHAHLDACSDCRHTLERFQALDRRLAGVPALACSSAAALVSAGVDGELGHAEIAAAEAHLATCGACVADRDAWGALDRTLAALPLERPSRRVDEAMARLTNPAPRRQLLPRAGTALGGTLAVLAAIALLLIGSLPAGVPETSQLVTEPLVASAQTTLFNPRTGTLYTLRPDEAIVAAVDAVTLEPRGLIPVGGRPTALALNEATNTILVLDATAQTVTEIDGARNTVVAATHFSVPGTPTSLQIDPNGKLVVVSVVAPSPTTSSAAARTPAPAAGVVSIFDGGTKKLETVRSVDVAPRLVVVEPNGARALLVSADSTTVVDAATYRALDTAPGGVAAAFSATSGEFVVLAVKDGGAVLTFALHHSVVAIAGAPRAIAPLPDGGFGVLSDLDGRGRITVVSGEGATTATLDAPPTGRALAYDTTARQFSVVSGGGVANVAFASVVATAPRAAVPPSASAPPAAGVSPTLIPAPQTSVTPTPPASPASLPTPPPSPQSAVVPTTTTVLVPTGAREVWSGTYLLALPGRRPVVSAADQTRIWFVDEGNRLDAFHMSTGQVFQLAPLPGTAKISTVVVGPNHVYLVDVDAGRLYVLTIDTEQLAKPVDFPFVRGATKLVAAPDGRLWIGTASLGLLSYDPTTQRTETVASGAISALASDPLGRIWFAPATREVLDVYDPLSGKVTELLFPHDGEVSAIALDRRGATWVGTDRGQIFAIRNDRLESAASTARSVDDLVIAPSGTAWFVSRGPDLVFGPASGARLPEHSPAGGGNPAFDVLGRAWVPDQAAGGFFVIVLADRP